MSGPFTNTSDIPPTAPVLGLGETKDYYTTWEDLLDSGETISTSVWTSSLTMSGETTNQNVTYNGVTYSASNGVFVTAPASPLPSYQLTNTITTSEGRTYSRSMVIPVRQL